MTPGRLDLHAHTTASDGLLEPAALVALALERGLVGLAVTDHDSTEGVSAALIAAEGRGLTVVPGVELGADVEADGLPSDAPEAMECHVLGYYIDPSDAAFQERLVELRVGRVARAEAIVSRLVGLGLSVSWERVRQIAGDGAVARPHVARALVEAGHVGSTREAFDLYLGTGRPAHVPRARLTPEEAVELITGAGGVAVLAHPVLGAAAADDPMREAALSEAERRVERLVAVGLRGIEVYYSGYDGALIGSLEALAERHGLIVTGGSDFHGPGLGHAELGAVPMPDEVASTLLTRLFAAADSARPASQAGRQRPGANR